MMTMTLEEDTQYPHTYHQELKTMNQIAFIGTIGVYFILINSSLSSYIYSV